MLLHVLERLAAHVTSVDLFLHCSMYVCVLFSIIFQNLCSFAQIENEEVRAAASSTLGSVAGGTIGWTNEILQCLVKVPKDKEHVRVRMFYLHALRQLIGFYYESVMISGPSETIINDLNVVRNAIKLFADAAEEGVRNVVAEIAGTIASCSMGANDNTGYLVDMCSDSSPYINMVGLCAIRYLRLIGEEELKTKLTANLLMKMMNMINHNNTEVVRAALVSLMTVLSNSPMAVAPIFPRMLEMVCRLSEYFDLVGFKCCSV